MERLVPIKLPPGLAKNGTVYRNKDRWINGNLVRWHEGSLQPVGGWVTATDSLGNILAVTGFPRGALAWRKNDATAWIAVGTTGTPSKLYAYSNGVLTDITPGGLANGAADGSVSTGAGGWGDGGWGEGGWGGSGAPGTVVDADTWSLDNFGEILLACLTVDGKIYESTPTAVATQVTNSPTCRAVVVTPERFIFALGATGDPRNVAWCSQQARTVWTPTASNSAGSFPLQTSGRLMTGRRTDRETLLFTDTDLWSAVFIGGSLIYSFTQRGNNCGLIGPNAQAIAEGAAFWMADGQFFVYDGAVRPIPCEVSDYVFGNLNRTQKAKIAAVPIPAFGEVWWFYPSLTQSGLENDRYVALNYRLGIWMTGSLSRAAGVGAGVFSNPQIWGSDSRLYSHENGNSRDSAAFAETGPLELGNGDQVVRLQSLIADERVLGQVKASFYHSFYPMATETLSATYLLAAKTDVRETGRQFRLRLEEATAFTGLTCDTTLHTCDTTTITCDDSHPNSFGGTDWRVGDFRVGVVAQGGR